MVIWVQIIGCSLATIGALLLILVAMPLRFWRAPQGNFNRAFTALLGIILVSILLIPISPYLSAIFVIFGLALVIYTYRKTSKPATTH